MKNGHKEAKEGIEGEWEWVFHRKIETGTIFTAILFGIFLDWTSIEIAIFAIFITSIVWPIASRLLALPALFLLVCVPVLLLLDREARAEEFAVYAYYFLVMAVFRGIVEARNEGIHRS